MIGRYQMPTQVEQVVFSRMGVEKPLRLMSGFESPHATLSVPGWLMQELRSIVRVLTGVVSRIRDDGAMSDSVAPQLICDDPSGFATAHPEQSLEKANCGLSVSTTL